MALDDASVEKQIERMVAFIKTEADEKLDDIRRKIEEDYQIERERVTRDGKASVDEEYAKKYRQVELRHRTDCSNIKSEGRMNVMRVKEDSVGKIIEEAKGRLSDITEDRTKYTEILEKLIFQGVLKLLEPTVLIRCKENDLCIVRQLLPLVARDFENITGSNITLLIDSEQYLPPEISGGVELITPDEKIRVNNTLEMRLELMALQALPDMRDILYGPNPNRKFDD